MPVWELSFSIRQFMLDFAIVSTLLVAGALLRAHVGILKRYLIPGNLIAGFVGLIIGPELLDWIDFSSERMGVYVYHLLALTFIGVGLKHTGGQSIGAMHIGFIKVLTFVLQALIGLGVALLFLWLISPDLIPAVGVLLPLGFGMGPGIAFSIGQSWQAHGFAEAANIGLTLAAIGFLVAYTTGLMVVNRGIRSGRATSIHRNPHGATDEGSVADRERGLLGIDFFGGGVDSLTFHLGAIGTIYLITYGLMLLMQQALVWAGQTNEIPTLWSLNFVVANLLALGVRKLMDANGVTVIDDDTINKVTGLLSDALIAAAIMAIGLSIAWRYIGPIAVMSILGALVTYFAVKWPVHRVFKKYPFERTVGLYAEQTGTISSGLAIIRVTDPDFETPVAQDQALGSGTALALGFPLLLMINLPLVWYGGSIDGYIVMTTVLVLYLAALLIGWRVFFKRTSASVEPA